MSNVNECPKRTGCGDVEFAGEGLIYLTRDGFPIEVPATLTLIVCPSCGRTPSFLPSHHARDVWQWVEEIGPLEGDTSVTRYDAAHYFYKRTIKTSSVKRRALRDATARALGARRHDCRVVSDWWNTAMVRRNGGDGYVIAGCTVQAYARRELRAALREAFADLRRREDEVFGELRRAPTKRELGDVTPGFGAEFCRRFVAIPHNDARAVARLAREYKTLRGQSYAAMREAMDGIAWLIATRRASMVNALALLAATRAVARWLPERTNLVRALRWIGLHYESVPRASFLRALRVCAG